MRLRKFLSKILIVLATFFVVLSPIVLVEEAHHQCTHEDCQICEVIRTAKETIKQTKVTPNAAVILIVLPLLFLFVGAIIAISKNNDFSSLVTLKTKLSN